MKELSKELQFFINIARLQSVMTRTFESKLGGMGYSEFIILYHLSQSRDEKMRRIDLANKVGLTASGITRLLLPMEKIGLVKREASEGDARVSFVALAEGGKIKLQERLEDAELLAKDLIPTASTADVEKFSALLAEIGRLMMY